MGGSSERISRLSGRSEPFQWQHTAAQAIEYIENDWFAYYFEKDGRASKLAVGATPDGQKYLTIQPLGGHLACC